MANCSFIKATEARNIARNDTLLWTEICEVQAAILAAIDGDPCATPPVQGAYSVIVAGGTPFTYTDAITGFTNLVGGSGFSIISATATIDANGTSPTVVATVEPVVNSNGVIDNFNITNAGAGYDPVPATASLQDPANLTNTQDNTDFDGAGGNGTFTAGDEYFVGEVITLTENSTVTVVSLVGGGSGFVTVAGDTDAQYNGVAANGSVPGGLPSGSGYVALDTITLSDGTIITVDSVSGGGVLTFTVTSSSTSSFATSGATLSQFSTDGVGSGFAIITGTNNETAVGGVLTFTLASPGNDTFFLGQSLDQASTTGIGTGFTLRPTTLNATTIAHGGVAATLTPIVTNGAVTSITINNGGTSYTVGNPILLTAPNITTTATASVASIDGSGTITGYVITNGGAGYDTATAQISVSHPSGTGFVGVVNTTGGTVINISIQNGGSGYSDAYPTIVISDVSGTGAQLNITGVSAGVITSVQLADGGSGYSDGTNAGETNASTLFFNSDGTPNGSASITLTKDAASFGVEATDYYSVLSGQATDAVIADQIQYVLDYFTALGYNVRVRAQVNPATGDTMQWQLIW